MGKGVNSKYIVSSELMSSKREFVIIFRIGTFALEIDFRILQIEMCYWFLTFSNYPSIKVPTYSITFLISRTIITQSMRDNTQWLLIHEFSGCVYTFNFPLIIMGWLHSFPPWSLMQKILPISDPFLFEIYTCIALA